MKKEQKIAAALIIFAIGSVATWVFYKHTNTGATLSLLVILMMNNLDQSLKQK